MSPNKLFLNEPNQEVVLFGKTFTADELKNALIDQAFLKGQLRELLQGGDD